MKTTNDPIYTFEEPSVLAYWGTYVALIILLVATFVLAEIDLGIWHTPVALLIALIKACLVMWFFMHVRSSQKLILLMFGAALILMSIGAFLTMTDYVTRAG